MATGSPDPFPPLNSSNRFLNDDCLILGSLEQWLESSTAREGGISSLITCPNLQVAVWRRPPHLLFQFTGACRAPRSNSPMAAATRKSSSPRLTGWSRKPASLDGVRDGIQKLNSEDAMWREKARQRR